MMTGYEEHQDFTYSTDAEWDRAAAAERGAADPSRAWILTDRDVWHQNPYYQGPPVRHPEDDQDDDDEAPTRIDVSVVDECPF